MWVASSGVYGRSLVKMILPLDTGLSWWIDYQNGVSVDYQYSLEHELSYLTLKYLYSWQ